MWIWNPYYLQSAPRNLKKISTTIASHPTTSNTHLSAQSSYQTKTSTTTKHQSYPKITACLSSPPQKWTNYSTMSRMMRSSSVVMGRKCIQPSRRPRGIILQVLSGQPSPTILAPGQAPHQKSTKKIDNDFKTPPKIPAIFPRALPCTRQWIERSSPSQQYFRKTHASEDNFQRTLCSRFQDYHSSHQISSPMDDSLRNDSRK